MLESTPAPQITAYIINPKVEMPIVPAYSRREWMSTHEGHAYHCLPLSMASQAGWFLLNPYAFTATWDGGDRFDSITVEYDEEQPPGGFIYAISLFRQGILTFNLPYLFRLSPGYNLLVRGPSNWTKEAIQPLEGLVESDWIEATFTMNWKFTHPNTPIRFERDEPFCMIVPMARGTIESFQPDVRPIESDPDLKERYDAWHQRRANSNNTGRLRAALANAYNRPYRTVYEGEYLKGIMGKDDGRFPDHQTRLDVKPFHARWQQKITAFLEKIRLHDQT